jgi:hypothetical protein
MTQLQQVLARLLTDIEFRNNVQVNGETALCEYMLSIEDLAALRKLDFTQCNGSVYEMGSTYPTVGRGGARDGSMPDRQ